MKFTILLVCYFSFSVYLFYTELQKLTIEQQSIYFVAMTFLKKSPSFIILLNLVVSIISILFYTIKKLFFGTFSDREVTLFVDSIWSLMYDYLFIISMAGGSFTFELVSSMIIYTFFLAIIILSKSRMQFFNESQTGAFSQRTRLFYLNIVCFIIISLITYDYFIDLKEFLTREGLCFHMFGIVTITSFWACYQQLLSMIHAFKSFRWMNFHMHLLISKFLSVLMSFMFELYFCYKYYESIGKLVLGIMLYSNCRRIYNTFTTLALYIQNVSLIHSCPLIDYEKMKETKQNENNEDENEFDEEDEEHLCVICRDDMKQCIRLSCGHEFHVECLQDWISRSKDCPLCRTTIDLKTLANEKHNTPNNNQNVRMNNQNNNATVMNNNTTPKNNQKKKVKNIEFVENSEDELINEWEIGEN